MSSSYFSSGITVVTEDSFEFQGHCPQPEDPVASTATTLRYYRSTNSTISTSDTQVGTDAVGALSSTGNQRRDDNALTAPSAAGTYYYGACVDPVAEETGTLRITAPRAVRVTVREQLPAAVVMRLREKLRNPSVQRHSFRR